MKKSAEAKEKRSLKKMIAELLKFGGSSFIGFLVDYSMFNILFWILGGRGEWAPAVCNVTARVISASVNFTINRLFVFKDKGNAAKSAAQYFVLAAGILAFNTVLVSVLINKLRWNQYIAKLITEITFFTLSWIAQKTLIFKHREED